MQHDKTNPGNFNNNSPPKRTRAELEASLEAEREALNAYATRLAFLRAALVGGK